MRGIGDYKLLDQIGEGSYGKVYKGIHRETQEFVAVKIISHDKFAKNPQLELYTINEINILTELGDAQGIAKYLNVLKSANNYYFIYQFCNGGTLKKIIDDYKAKGETIPITQSVKYLSQILNAFRLLTKNKTMHRDIKPANILLHQGKIKIADFGLSKCMKSPTDVAETMVGSPLYMAPEILKGESYTMKADIWSLGVVFYEMVYGKCPFDSRDIGKLIEVQRNQDVKFGKVGGGVENVLRRMLVKEPSKRIDWSELFEYKIVGGEIIQPSGSPTRHLNTPQREPPTSTATTHQPRYNSPSFQPPTNNPRTNTTINYPTQQSPSLKLISHLDTHQKILRASQLSISTLRHSSPLSIPLSYLINKTIQRELNQILQQLNKMSGVSKGYLKTEEDLKIGVFKEMVVDELIELKCALKGMRQVLQGMSEDLGKIESKKWRCVKGFYKNIRQQKREREQEDSIVLVSQMIDLFSESIIVKKQAYKKASKGEMVKEIERKLSELN